ncbi:hypothetical protein [Cryptosporangium sp. NPDC051539]|uniref:hypothetical protein n=1 Tax=Cryptosporangium sp. NPDC051539 TaxID=3363962 RepID=UPI0037B588B2
MARVGRSFPTRPIISRGPVAPGLLYQSLVDDFEDNILDTTRWPNTFGVTSEVGGRARVQCDTGFNGYRSAKTFGIPGSTAVTQVVTLPSAAGATTAYADLLIESDTVTAGTRILFRADAAMGLLTAALQVGFADGGAVTAAFNPLAPIWLRVREAAGQVVFDYSLDGYASVGWTTLRTASTPAWMTTSTTYATLQSHRDAGAADFTEFGSFGLFLPDPIAAPPPLYIRAQRRRPLPPGAIILRAPDTRLPPSNRVAVGLDGSLLLPISVRLTSHLADVLLVEEVRDLTFRTRAPGGFSSATLSLHRPVDEICPEIQIFGRMYVYDTTDGSTLWEGRIEDPGKSSGEDGQVWDVTAIGPSAHAQDEHFPYVPIDTSIDHYVKFGGSKANTTVSTFTDANDNDGVKVAFPGGVAAAAPQYVSARSLRIYNAGLALGSVRATAYASDTSPGWESRMYVYPAATLIDSTTISTSPTSFFGEVGVDFAFGQTMLHLRMDRTNPSSPTSDEIWTFWYDIVVRSALVDEEGHPVSDHSDPWVTSSQIVQDLIGSHTSQYDPLDAFIEETSQHITQLAYDSTTVVDTFNDLMALEGAFYWAAWETIARSGKWRIEWRPWPTNIKYSAGIEDGWSSPGSAADLYNKVAVTWTNKVGRQQTTTRTNSVPVLTRAGLTRSDRIDLGSEIGSAAAAISTGDAYLGEHAMPSQNGRLTIARPVPNFETGHQDPPQKIRAGGLIQVRGVDPLPNALNSDGRDGVTNFRIVATDFRLSDGTVELELDTDALSTSRAIAQLQRRRTRH